MELLRRLRAGGNIVPVVILTAHGSIPEAVEAMKLGAIDFLTKPTTPDALRRVVAEVIERHAVPVTDAASRRPGPKPPDPVKQIAFELVRAKRAINRGQFSEAEVLLRDMIASIPGRTEAHELLDRLLTLKEQEARGSFRILRNWFPSGTVARGEPSKLMKSRILLDHAVVRNPAPSAWPFSVCFSQWSPPATIFMKPRSSRMLYLTGR